MGEHRYTPKVFYMDESTGDYHELHVVEELMTESYGSEEYNDALKIFEELSMQMSDATIMLEDLAKALFSLGDLLISCEEEPPYPKKFRKRAFSRALGRGKYYRMCFGMYEDRERYIIKKDVKQHDI